MNPNDLFRQNIDNYLGSARSVAQSGLEGLASLTEGKEQLIQSGVSAAAALGESAIQGQVTANTQKFLKEMGVDMSTKGVLEASEKGLNFSGYKLQELGKKYAFKDGEGNNMMAEYRGPNDSRPIGVRDPQESIQMEEIGEVEDDVPNVEGGGEAPPTVEAPETTVRGGPEAPPRVAEAEPVTAAEPEAPSLVGRFTSDPGLIAPEAQQTVASQFPGARIVGRASDYEGEVSEGVQRALNLQEQRFGGITQDTVDQLGRPSGGLSFERDPASTPAEGDIGGEGVDFGELSSRLSEIPGARPPALEFQPARLGQGEISDQPAFADAPLPGGRIPASGVDRLETIPEETFTEDITPERAVRALAGSDNPLGRAPPGGGQQLQEFGLNDPPVFRTTQLGEGQTAPAGQDISAEFQPTAGTRLGGSVTQRVAREADPTELEPTRLLRTGELEPPGFSAEAVQFQPRAPDIRSEPIEAEAEIPARAPPPARPEPAQAEPEPVGSSREVEEEAEGRPPVAEPEPEPVTAEPVTAQPVTAQPISEPKISEPDISGETSEISENIASETKQVAASAAEEAGEITSSLGGEIASAAGKGLSMLGGFLGDIMPFVAPIMAGVGMYEGLHDINKTFQDAGNDPYAKVRQQVNAGQNKINSMAATISSDQFSEKVAGAAPSFGSLAAPTFSTAQQTMGATGHF